MSNRHWTRNLAVAALVLATSQGVTAAPINDNIGNATPILALPFTQTVTSIETATTESSDPIVVCRTPRAKGSHSIWYQFTTGAQDGYYNLITSGSYETLIALYTDTSAQLAPVFGGCNDDGVTGSTTLARLNGVRIPANTTVLIEVVAETALGGAQTLTLQMEEAPRYIVTKFNDTQDGNCTAGDCSLREAVSASNTNPGAILLGAGTYTLSLPTDPMTGGIEDGNLTGDLDLNRGMAIYGQAAATVVSASGITDRIFDVQPSGSGSATVTLDGLTVRDGRGSVSFATGGGMAMMGDRSTLFVGRATFRDNLLLGQGGAITANGNLIIEQSLFKQNQNSARGAGVHFFGSGTFEVRDSLFEGNIGGNGGAIYSTGQLFVINTTLTGNRAGANGGAIQYDNPSGSFQLLSSTVVDNQAGVSGIGGGLHLMNSANPPTLRNSIIAGNTAGGSSGSQDCNTIFSIGSYNHIGSSDCISNINGNANNTFGPVTLLPLANLGGPTQVRAIPAGSSLIDSGDPNGCTDNTGLELSTDQRGAGFARELDGNFDVIAQCDKGAFELLVSNDIFKDGFD